MFEPPKQSATSEAARHRLQASPGEPLFTADWTEVLLIHLQVEPERLQPCVPFELDLYESWAYVSLVLFTMRRFRPARGGRLAQWFFRLLPAQQFLNVRTYVRCADEPGIHFIAEWISDRLACKLGPPLYCLPYRLGRHRQDHDLVAGQFHGCVTDAKTGCRLRYEARTRPAEETCHAVRPGSLDDFLLERYAAFNAVGRRRKAFRIWHPPWQQIPVQVFLSEDRLLSWNFPWLSHARFIGGNYSPGVLEVWMGRPRAI
jgi:uncharacterized protein YqjF (DUF2071 family)